jgi:peptidoglycan/xylan/chitin deacetylase (PgdA/CDA1 family)
VFSINRNLIQRKSNKLISFFKKRKCSVRPAIKSVGYLTIFHDFEANYSHLTTKKISFKGIAKLLELEKTYNVACTYNIVGKLMKEIPELISRIKYGEHEIASHSYAHKVMTELKKEQILSDLKLTKDIFQSYDLKLRGFRSPQSKWNSTLLHALLENGIKWNAEDENTCLPYVILQKNGSKLLRLPIKLDDWLYKSKEISPDEMYKLLITVVDKIANEKKYGSIGFHPWIQGEDERRLNVFENFLKYATQKQNIRILTFSKMQKLCSE